MVNKEQEQVAEERERDNHQLPWIKKYLELADLLIRRGRSRAAAEQHRDGRLRSDAIGAPEQADREKDAA